MNRTKKNAVAVALLLASGALDAATIDFNDLAHDNAISYVGPILNTGLGFLVSGPNLDYTSLAVWPRYAAAQADFGNATLFGTYGNAPVTITSSASQSFNFISIDLADVYNNGPSPSPVVSFTFNYTGGGSASQSVTLDSQPGLQTFTFGEIGQGVQSVSWSSTFSGNPFNQFDNIVVTTAVPEPETYAMLLAGLGLLGALTRRRKTLRHP
jgi:hypothetical protein